MAEELEPERIVRLEEDPPTVVLLDQRRLPHEVVELSCGSAAEVADAIRTMVVRGAPAIGVAAAYGMALAALRGEDLTEAERVLGASRPTAVNLPWALAQMRGEPTAERARALHRDEVERCRRMAVHAAELFDAGTRAPVASRPGATAPRSERSVRRGREASSNASSSTRRGRSSREPASLRGSSSRPGSRTPSLPTRPQAR
jgi:Mg-chelatase subunit ChlI